MRKVLIVSPHWPPVSAVDMHRVRTAMPYFEEFGWEATILACDPAEHAGVLEPELERTVPTNAAVVRVRAIPRRGTEWAGIRNETIRSLPALAVTGAAMLSRERFDLVFISTTMFPAFLLGRLWHAIYRVPYVLDYQDPWVSDYRGAKTGLYGTRKYAFAQRLSRTLEPIALRAVSGLICVSEAYPEILRRRYPWISEKDALFLPFGGAHRDFDIARLGLESWQNPVFARRDGFTHWVYVGRGGEDMRVAASALFSGFRQCLEEDVEKFRRVRMHFIGTSYADRGKGKRTISPIAEEFGVGAYVEERTDRMPYLDTLRTLLASDALLMLGSDDPTYNASKLYPYLLAERPMLAIFNRASHVSSILQEMPAVEVCTFGDDDRLQVSKRVREALPNLFTMESELRHRPEVPLSGREATHRMTTFFDRIIESPGGATADDVLARKGDAK